MPKAPPLPRPSRLFEPARYSQHHLARAYSQFMPYPRRVSAPTPPATATVAAAARVGMAS